MPRFALKIEYDGAPFAGWQRQKTAPSVQATVEAALSRLEPDLPAIAAAGRTDAGVHATAQVVHCDMARDWDAFRLSEALNYHLKPAPVAILAAARVDPEFHARFSALGRHYLYRLQSRRAPLTHDRGQVWRINHRLDIAAMQTAAADLIGRHDFTTFRSTHCQAKSPEKTLDRIDISATEIPHGTEYRFRLSARSFLHNQVRSIVGTLERIGTGNWPVEAMKSALDAKDRTACGPVAPPDGLYLTRVDYQPDPFTG